MNRTNLKNYAPQARRDFIQAMTDRAAYFGLTDTKSEPVVVKGDVAVIGGRSFPFAVAKKRKQLEDRIKRHGPDWSKGFAQTMEAMAYTWFNRLVAIRFMELHGYLDHGYRVLSHPEGKPTPEILEHAEHVELPGLKKEVVIDLKLAGNKEGELYRLLLTSQCNALHTAMPFLFEKIEGETELLLPDNLLNSDSLMRKLVGEIEEEDWKEVEIIGWLYQFYISEKKDEVIGKVVASEDIPAATQLFTPNWIVKYLVQNTLGRQWLEHHPESPLKAKMEYYIEPAEQTSDVQAQLQQVIEARTKANRGLTADCPLPSADFSLNPEELTLLDPACGSGHILVEAYDLFKAIYQERGYRAKDIAALILQKNLFGMEIDDRAAQLAAFALMMKARADDRRIFDSEAKPNILAFEDSQGMNANEIAYALNAPINKDDIPNEYLFEEIQEEKDGLFSKKALAEKGHVSQGDIAALLELFENAKTFGSLIQVPPKLAAKLPEIEERLDEVLKFGDLTHASAHVLKPFLQQARLLCRQYDTVVANPPYMGSKYQTSAMKSFIFHGYSACRPDMFAAFVQRSLAFGSERSELGFVVPYVWMFLGSYEGFRDAILTDATISSLIQLEYNAFEPACVPVCSFTLSKPHVSSWQSAFIKLSDFKGHQNQAPRTLEAIQNRQCGWFYTTNESDIRSIPGQPIAFSVPASVRHVFSNAPSISMIASARQGLATADNARFLRRWFEVSRSRTGFSFASRIEAQKSGMRWFPHSKGGEFRKWYGNNEYVVDWQNDGEWMRSFERAVIRNADHYFREGVTWSHTSSSTMSVRYVPAGYTFNCEGPTLFTDTPELMLGYMGSRVCTYIMEIMNPTLHFLVGTVSQLPFDVVKADAIRSQVESIVRKLVLVAKYDWDSSELSWDFQALPLLSNRRYTIEESRESVKADSEACFAQMRSLEAENNRLFIEAYGLQADLSPEVPDDQITLYRPDRQEDIKRLVSYAIGCVMGRYSLDKPGLIYAHGGNQGFDSSQYKTFRADDDGIIPLLETDWGIRDDATNRFVEFIGVAWPKEHLEGNVKFVADSLVATGNEQPRETIRRYLATGFYKHHLSMYKKRPIYWLFSSGKQRAFQCLVYLHRYHEGTLARMRTEYVIPLQGQIAGRIEQLEGDTSKATSTSHRKKLQKEQDDLKKQQTELLTFEEKLKHAADQKISLDLDDGVKVNYAKFGDLLAESKAITGGKEEEE